MSGDLRHRMARLIEWPPNAPKMHELHDLVADHIKTLVDELHEEANRVAELEAVVERVRTRVQRWRDEAIERGPDDMLITSGVVAQLAFDLHVPQEATTDDLADKQGIRALGAHLEASEAQAATEDWMDGFKHMPACNSRCDDTGCWLGPVLE